MISKDKTRLKITLDKNTYNLLEAMSKTSHKTKSDIVWSGIWLFYASVRGDVKIEPTEEELRKEN